MRQFFSPGSAVVWLLRHQPEKSKNVHQMTSGGRLGSNHGPPTGPGFSESTVKYLIFFLSVSLETGV